MTINRCTFCVTQWVDLSLAAAKVQVTDLERRQLIATLLSRPHLILSGPPGVGKGQLVRTLALVGVEGERDRVCWLRGHPWWAANTASVGRFVELQTDLSLSRLAHFANSARDAEESSLRYGGTGSFKAANRNGREAGPMHGVCAFVACVERVSPVEIELYFRVVAEWLVTNGKGAKGASSFVPLRLVGTYDGTTPPNLDDRILRVTGLVHLSGILDGASEGYSPDSDRALLAQA
jgi:hypothetical protein